MLLGFRVWSKVKSLRYLVHTPTLPASGYRSVVLISTIQYTRMILLLRQQRKVSYITGCTYVYIFYNEPPNLRIILWHFIVPRASPGKISFWVWGINNTANRSVAGNKQHHKVCSFDKVRYRRLLCVLCSIMFISKKKIYIDA